MNTTPPESGLLPSSLDVAIAEIFAFTVVTGLHDNNEAKMKENIGRVLKSYARNVQQPPRETKKHSQELPVCDHDDCGATHCKAQEPKLDLDLERLADAVLKHWDTCNQHGISHKDLLITYFHQSTAALSEKLDELLKLPMPLPADPKHPFYIETMEQAKQLKEMATRTGMEQAIKLETIARKLEYMTQSFTCTANFVPLMLELKVAQARIEELEKAAKNETEMKQK